MLLEKKDFTFETVLSTDRNLKLLERAKGNGLFTILLGVFAGNDIKHQWFLPAVPIVFRYIGGWICNEDL